MLTLIIQIVKERRFCGLSTAENLRRELVYKLAVGDATHSQLVKALPNGLSKSDELQKTVDSLAVYSNPSGIKQVLNHLDMLTTDTQNEHVIIGEGSVMDAYTLGVIKYFISVHVTHPPIFCAYML